MFFTKYVYSYSIRIFTSSYLEQVAYLLQITSQQMFFQQLQYTAIVWRHRPIPVYNRLVALIYTMTLCSIVKSAILCWWVIDTIRNVYCVHDNSCRVRVPYLVYCTYEFVQYSTLWTRLFTQKQQQIHIQSETKKCSISVQFST